MNFRDRLENAWRGLTAKSLSTSITSGEVLRNYSPVTKFNPRTRVKGITYKAVDKIGQTISKYRPIVMRGERLLKEHPVLSLFEKPNPYKTASDFIWLWAMQFEIYGETFWYKARGENTNRIKELYLLDPTMVQIYYHKGVPQGYVLHKSDGGQIPLPLEDVLHDARPNPFNEWRGMSILEKASVYLDTEVLTANFTMNYIKNAASPSGIVSLPAMDTETFKQFTRKWREGYEGTENAGKTAFIRNGEVKFQAIGSTLKDIDQEITRKMAEDDVLMMLEVPKPLLGRSGEKGLGRSDIEALLYIYNSEKIEPMMLRLDYIFAKIAGEMDDSTGLSITHDNPTPEDKEFEHKINKDLVNVALTVNEVRQRIGLQSLGSEYDKIVDNNAIAEADNEDDNRDKIVPKQRIVLKTQKNDTVQAGVQQEKLIAVAEEYAVKYKQVLADFSEEQKQRLLSKIKKSITISKSFEEWLFNIKEEATAMGAILMPLLLEQTEVQAEDVVNWITGKPFELSESVKQKIEARILRLSADYQLANYTDLERIITEDVAAGKSVGAIKRDIENEYSQIKGYKAERIARTESIRTANFTAAEVYYQSGYSRLRWRINPGACEFCQTFDGQTIEIGKSFAALGSVVVGTEGNQMTIDYDSVYVPALHPNCKCSVDPVA